MTEHLKATHILYNFNACMQTRVQAPADIRYIWAEISYPCSWWALQKIKSEKCSDTTLL